MVVEKNGRAAQKARDSGSQSPTRLLRKIGDLEREIALTRKFAYHDALTGLVTRELMLDRLEYALGQADRQSSCVGVILLKIDDFERVSGNLGSLAGDTLIKQVSARLLGDLRANETACRYGNHEFVVLLPDIQDAAHVELVRRKLAQRLGAPHRLATRSVTLRISIGCALFKQGDSNAAALIAAAASDLRRTA